MRVVDIVQGFLDSGKTTLIDVLIREVLSNETILVIQTECGECQLPDYGSRVKVVSWDWEKGFPLTEMRKLVLMPGFNRVIFEVNGMAPVEELLDSLEVMQRRGEITIGGRMAVFYGPIWQVMGKPMEDLFRRMALSSQGFWLREGSNDLYNFISQVQPKGCKTSGGEWLSWYYSTVDSDRYFPVKKIAKAAAIVVGMLLFYGFLYLKI
ncbi:hypothetical protein Dtox_0339 [Desulfofarcimen acetoxidans DSM 771]|uniref:CobW/HypB/UreG nucleotide-binding domain-containing protein n=1 Tax=Desulfofarcimen acetoxidans (strain ATCC 49208 / DSM 771 / KCTC 5769 / VKM B-1644 / 5575) TaxID=485916 RepID=C8W438_DESAS|nr:hypothetical protein [Desulfofarcimen acetoxidans]ACV61292.1 hypothetical protein Dtox_0339 [Desulfofarcimen acetoxidans DSM 771]